MTLRSLSAVLVLAVLPATARAQPVDGTDDARFAPVTDEGADLSTPWGAAAANLTWGGSVKSETHYRLQEKTVGSFYDSDILPQQFVRNENTLNLKLNAGTGRFIAVADIDFDWLGFSEGIDGLDGLSRPEAVSPVRLETHALYLEAVDIGLEGLDLRIGQQVVQWGVGDQFNPTNNLNADDLENVLYFGRQKANLMARVDYGVSDMWTLSAVFVPVFMPAVIPASARLGLAEVDRLPFVSDELRWRLHNERELAVELGTPTVVSAIHPTLPEPRIKNSQWAVNIGGPLFGHDVAVSYYEGRTDFPVATANHITQRMDASCNPDNTFDCIDGLLETEVTLRYPRMRVLGINLAGEVDALGWMSKVVHPIGYRFEVGFYYPKARRFTITQDDIILLGMLQPAGEFDYGLPNGERPLVVESQPFAKWVAGIDYSFGRHVYANVMWVHGLVDEYGAGDFLYEGWSVRSGGIGDDASAFACFLEESGEECATETLHPKLGDYLVAGIDIRFLDQRALARLFVIFDLNGYTIDRWDNASSTRVREKHAFLSSEGRSMVIYPELQYAVGGGLVLSAGALLQFGKSYTKFGDPAAGGSLGWMRATFSY